MRGYGVFDPSSLLHPPAKMVSDIFVDEATAQIYNDGFFMMENPQIGLKIEGMKANRQSFDFSEEAGFHFWHESVHLNVVSYYSPCYHRTLTERAPSKHYTQDRIRCEIPIHSRVLRDITPRPRSYLHTEEWRRGSWRLDCPSLAERLKCHFLLWFAHSRNSPNTSSEQNVGGCVKTIGRDRVRAEKSPGLIPRGRIVRIHIRFTDSL